MHSGVQQRIASRCLLNLSVICPNVGKGAAVRILHTKAGMVCLNMGVLVLVSKRGRELCTLPPNSAILSTPCGTRGYAEIQEPCFPDGLVIRHCRRNRAGNGLQQKTCAIVHTGTTAWKALYELRRSMHTDELCRNFFFWTSFEDVLWCRSEGSILLEEYHVVQPR